MEIPANIVDQWHYLRGLLSEQLAALARGSLQVHSNEINVSPAAIAKLQRSIAEFDALIAAQEAQGGRAGDDRQQRLELTKQRETNLANTLE